MARAIAKESLVPDFQQHQAASHLTITRSLPDDLRQRGVIVTLDGERIVELMNGESVTREISPGHHRLRADNTWNRKTIEFDAAPGGHLKFEVTNRAGGLSKFFQFTFGGGPVHLSIERMF